MVNKRFFNLWFKNTVNLFIVFYLAKLFFQFLIELKSQETIPRWLPQHPCPLGVILASWIWAFVLVFFGWKKDPVLRIFIHFHNFFSFSVRICILMILVSMLVWFFEKFRTVIYIVFLSCFQCFISPLTRSHLVKAPGEGEAAVLSFKTNCSISVLIS